MNPEATPARTHLPEVTESGDCGDSNIPDPSCSECLITFPLEQKLNCLTCNLNPICSSCVLLHCRKNHEVYDVYGHQPDLCPEHKFLYVHYCNTCSAFLCVNCTPGHFTHELVTLESKVKEARKKIHEAMAEEDENLKIVLHRKDEIQRFYEKQKSADEEYKKREVIESIMKAVRQVLEEFLDARQPKTKAILRSAKKIRRIERCLEKSYKRARQCREMLSSPTKAIVEATANLPLSSLVNYSHNAFQCTHFPQQFAFDSRILQKKFKLLLATCMTTPTVPSLRFRTLHEPYSPKDPTLVCVWDASIFFYDSTHGVIACMHVENKVTKIVKIPSFLQSLGEPKAIVRDHCNAFLVIQLRDSLYKLDRKHIFSKKPLAQLRSTQTLLCLSKRELYIWDESEGKKSLVLAKQWSLEVIIERPNHADLPTKPYSKCTANGFSGFLAGKRFLSSGSSYYGIKISIHFHWDNVKIVSLEIPFSSFCLIHEKPSRYLVFHGKDSTSAKWFIRKFKVEFDKRQERQTANITEKAKGLEVPKEYKFMEVISCLSKLLVIDAEGQIELIDFL